MEEKNMNDLTCPHCLGSVPRGATVCRGCQAEIEYGASMFVLVMLLVFAIFMGVLTASMLPEALSFVGWIVGIGSLYVGGKRIGEEYKDRVEFKRVYRTK